MQIDAQHLLAEAGEMALTIRLLEKQNAALAEENARLRAEAAVARIQDGSQPAPGGTPDAAAAADGAGLTAKA